MTDVTTLIKKSDYDTTIAEIESKYVSNIIENNIKKLHTFDLSYFRGKSHFEKMVHKII